MTAVAPLPHRLYLEEELTQDGDGAAGGAAAGTGGATATAGGALSVGADDDASDDDVHLGAVACSIVGMRYYQGVVHQGEWVELVREPSNPYDANAIRVENMARVQVGLTLAGGAAARQRWRSCLAVAEFGERGQEGEARLVMEWGRLASLVRIGALGCVCCSLRLRVENAVCQWCQRLTRSWSCLLRACLLGSVFLRFHRSHSCITAGIRPKVGHISRGEAFYLAPFMDESPATRLRLLATLPSRPRSKFRCPVRIDFFGPPERQERLATRLDTAMEYTSPEDCDGIGAAGAQEGEPAPVEGPPAASAGRRSAAVAARATLAATVASRTSAPRGGAGAGQSAADLDRLFDDAAASRAASLAAAGAALRPPPSLAAVLFPHQAAGVAWALARETAPADSVPPFWSTAVEGGRDVWFNSLTNSSVAARPPPVTGGLLADEMGVGKTLQVISLLLAHPPFGVVYAPPVEMETEAERAAPVDRQPADGDGSPSTKPAGGAVMAVKSESGAGPATLSPLKAETMAETGTATPSPAKAEAKVEPDTLAAVESVAAPTHHPSDVKEEVKAEPGALAIEPTTTNPVGHARTRCQSRSASIGVPAATCPPSDSAPAAVQVLSRTAVHQLKVAALRAALVARGVQTADELAALRRPALATLLEEHEAGRRAAETGTPAGAPGGAEPTAAAAAPPASGLGHAVAPAPAMQSFPALTPAPAVAPVTTRYGDTRDAPARTTLVLAPLSVLSAWETQLADLVAPGVLRVTVYHGAGRTTDVAALAENDVIVASYGTLASEWSADAADDATGDGRRPPARKKRKSGAAAAHAGVLARVPLRRLVLDEAHILRNGERTRLFKAVMALNAPLRWALTGTPVVNRADDLQPLLAWLRVAPLESRRVWNRAISLPLSAGDEAGLARLRTVVGSLCLRRTRAAVPALAALLPPAATEVVTLRMTGPQRAAYDLLFTAARRVFQTALGARFRSGGVLAAGEGERGASAVSATGGEEPPSAAASAGAADGDGDAAATAAAGVLGAHFSSILEVITRLRQICAAPALLPPARLHRARTVLAHLDRLEAAATAAGTASGGDGVAALSPDAVTRLFAMLAGAVADADRRDCAVCMEVVTDESARILTRCRHTFCEACLATLLQLGRGAGVCPMCRQGFRGGDVTSLEQLRERGAGQEERIGIGDDKDLRTVAGEKSDIDSNDSGDGDGGSGCVDGVSGSGDGGSSTYADADAAAAADTGAKASAILAMLTTTPPDEKTVVFSQFTSFLDLLERSLTAAGWRRGTHFVRLDGSVSRPARAAALGRLRDAPSCRLLLASLTAGGVGISLVAANRVVLADPWWNAAAEAQAADRVCRLGQRRRVTVVKLVMDASVEAAMVDLQAAKAAVAQGALGRLSPAQVRQAHARRLLRLFE